MHLAQKHPSAIGQEEIRSLLSHEHQDAQKVPVCTTCYHVYDFVLEGLQQ